MGDTPRVLIAGLAFFLGFIPSIVIVFVLGNPHFGVLDLLPNWAASAVALVLFFGIPIVVCILVYWRIGPKPLPPDLCPKCGYDLRAAQSETCPECGHSRKTDGSPATYPLAAADGPPAAH